MFIEETKYIIILYKYGYNKKVTEFFLFFLIIYLQITKKGFSRLDFSSSVFFKFLTFSGEGKDSVVDGSFHKMAERDANAGT